MSPVPWQIRELFPFFLALDHELVVVDFGRAAPKVHPAIRRGARFQELFRVFRPRLEVSFAGLLGARASVFFLDSLASEIRMRGQMIPDEDAGILLFAGSPWFLDIEALTKTPLELKDFTVHDPIVDFLYMVQAKTVALDDARRFSETVAKQRDELAEANRKLAHAAAAKSQFLANTSHELRTPLNGIIGMLSLLQRTDLGQQQRNYAEVALKSAKALLAIVNDILDFSKVEAGKLSLVATDFDVHRLAYEVAEVFAITVQPKGVEILCLIEDGVPHALRGDPDRLRQVLANLIGNAAKFTARGEIILRVSRGEGGPDEVVLRFGVTDTGIGIPAAQQAHLFEAFSQVDGSMSRRHGGTGLGLVISKNLAQLMGGEIGLDSEPGRGSTFWFTARLQKPDGHVAGASAPPSAGRRALENVRVLVADPHAKKREHLLTLFSRWGMRAVGVADAIQALEAIRGARAAGDRYSVAVLDAQIAGMTAMDLAVIVSDDPAFDELRLIMLISAEDEAQGARAGKARIDAYLAKPVRPSSMFDCLTGLFRDDFRPSREEIIHRAPARVSTLPPPAHGPRVLVVDDNPVNLEVAARMLEALGCSSDLAANGKLALEALDHAHQSRYAAIFMDLQMPELDGYATTEEIRRREAGGLRRTPIIAMTAHAMETDKAKTLSRGMDDYLSKPIDFEILGELLDRWLPVTREATAATAPGAGAFGPGEPGDVLDPKALDDLRTFQKPDAPDFVGTVVQKYLFDLGGRTKIMRRSAESGDWVALSQCAHALKSSSAIVGASQLVKLCAELEARGRSGEVGPIPELVRRFSAECERVQRALEPLSIAPAPSP